MKYTIEVKSIYNCSVERAFKTPMLCDVKKVHTGFLAIPKVSHCEDDAGWGKPGGSRRVFMDKNRFFKGGEAALDTVVVRKENEYWKIRIDNFKAPMIGIRSLEGEWITERISDRQTRVVYRYALFSDYKLAEPLHWWFTKIFWKSYMKHALDNIKVMAEGNEPYFFD